MTDPRPIGVFDSGVGGLTVLREILRRTPGESTIYFGDNARAPYGVRPDEEVRTFSTESIDALVERDVKAVVVACNTSTAVALGDLRRRYDLPILGVIRPGATSAALATRNRRVGVIGTPATIRSHAYFSAIKDENPADRGLRARDADVRAHGRGRPARRRGGRGRGSRRARAAPRRTRCGRRVHLPAPAVRPDRHAPAGLHALPAAARRDRGGDGGGDRDRRFGLRDGVGARRAPVDQRARCSRRSRHAPPAHHRRRRRVPLDRRAHVRRGLPGRRRAWSSASRHRRSAHERAARREPALPVHRLARGPALAGGLPARLGDRRGRDRARLGAPSGPRAAASSTGAPSSERRSGAPRRRRAGSPPSSSGPRTAPIASRWPASCRASARRSGRSSRASSSARPSSIARAGSGPTSGRSASSSRGWRTSSSTRSCPRVAA